MMPISTSVNLLIVEDDEPKLEAINEVVSESMPDANIIIARSVAAALNVIEGNRIDLAIIDMSLPAFDYSMDVSGGKPQGEGGRDILRFLDDFQPSARALILTQYAEFNKSKTSPMRKLEDITNELQGEYGEFLIDVIYYSGRRGSWSQEVKNLLNIYKKEIQ